MLTRRQLVRASLLAPFAATLAARPRTARAQNTRVAKRLILFFSPNGTVHSHWRPTGTGANYSFPTGSILEPLDAHRSDLLILDGLDFKNANNHEGGMAAMLTGTGGASSPTTGMSVDQWIASRLNTSTRFASLELGVQTSAWGGSVQTRMCYRRAGEYVSPADQPVEVFRRLFGDTTASPTPVDVLLTRRQSVLDLLRSEIGALQTKLGSDEKAKLDAHLTSLRSVELGLAPMAPPPASCSAPSDMYPSNAGSNENFPAVTRAQTDLLVAALACDFTRVASLQCSHTVSPTAFTWLGLSDAHHTLSHTDDGHPEMMQNFVAAERWFAEQFGYLIDKLKSLPEPGEDGSMFDHSLVAWVKELGDSRLHECRSVPFVLTGGANGFLSLGRYLRYDNLSHQKLLVSLCRGMGLEQDVFGDPTVDSGALEDLS